MTVVANRLRTLNDPHSELFKPVTALVWPGSPFPLPLKDYHGLMLTVILVMLAAAMLLIVACANVGSLQLARARSREHEMLTRLSLGASRGRIVRQLLTESALLGLMAGCVGLALAWAFLHTAIAVHAQLVPAEFSSLVFNVNPDPEIFAYVFATSLVAGILFGTAPAVETSRFAIASGDRSGTASFRTRAIQNLLVTAQVALSLALMIAASMLIRSANRSLHMETGYDAKHVIDIDLQFPESSRLTPARKLDEVGQLRSRLTAIPDVAAVTTSAHAPADLGFRTAATGLDHGKSSLLHYTYVQRNYFATLGIPILFGNGFPSEAASGRSVILSESAAERIWPGQNPIGRSLRLGQLDEHSHAANELVPDSGAWQVIGVARDTRGAEFDGSDSAQVYLPLSDAQIANRPILIRTHSDPAPVLKKIDALVSSVDAQITANSSTLNEMLRRSAPFITATLAAAIASSVGLLGLLLALMGIYGTVNYIVVLRTREVGIRMAIGAQKRDVLWLILRESTRPVLAGLVVGMLFGGGCSYLLRGVLYGLKTVDTISFIGMATLFLLIALLAAYPPSRRATRIDPIVALRYE
jgi:predicted permease